MSVRREQKIKSQIELIQKATEHVDIKDAASHIGKGIGLHLDQMREFWEIAFFVKYGVKLDISKTDLWKNYRKRMVDFQLLLFLEPKTSLFDFYAQYAPEYLKKYSKQDL